MIFNSTAAITGALKATGPRTLDQSSVRDFTAVHAGLLLLMQIAVL